MSAMKQNYLVDVVIPGPSNAVGSHEHPILESGNLSFPAGRYSLNFEFGDDRLSCHVTHEIEGAALIEQLLEKDLARYVCIVSSPSSAYRETHISKTPRHEVRWVADDMGESPMFTPMIVCSEGQEVALEANRHNLHQIWDNQTITLDKGSRLAHGNVVQLESSIHHLLSINNDEKLEKGQVVVKTNSQPFYFRVNVSNELHRFLQHGSDVNRHNIMTHLVTACLALLQRDYSEDDGESGWKSYRNLVALDKYLQSRGCLRWTDDEFQPEKVATALYPHILPEHNLGDAEDGSAT